MVGTWDEDEHLNWAKKRQNVKRSKVKVNTGEQVKAGKTVHDEDGYPITVWDADDTVNEAKEVDGDVQEVELWYANGEVCDITKKPREVLVRLKVSIQLNDSLLPEFSANKPRMLSRCTSSSPKPAVIF